MQIIARLNNTLRNRHFLSLTGNGIMSVLGMATIAILYRALSMYEIGIWVFFQTTVLLIDTFRSGFITTAFIKFYAGSDATRATQIAGSAWYIGSIITGSLALLTLPFLFFLDNIHSTGLALFFRWFAISFILTLPSFIASCILQSEQKFGKLLYLRFTSQASFILIVIGLIFFDKTNLNGIVYANLAASFITSVVCIIAGWSRISSVSKRTKEITRELYHFGKFSVGTTLSANLFRSSDTFIIGFMLGPAAVAVYNIGLRLMELVEIPLRSFAATAMPSLSAAFNKDRKQEVIYIMQKYTGILTMLLIPAALVVAVFSNLAIDIIGGEKYIHTEAPNIFRFFMTFALLYPADRFLALSVDAINKPKVNFLKVLAMLVVNVIGDFIGIAIMHNVYGVIFPTGLSTIVGVWVGYYTLNRYEPFKFIDIYKLGFKESKAFLVVQYAKLRAFVKSE